MASSSNPLTPGTNHFITLADARVMTALFRAEKENILDPAYRGQDILSICETFNRNAFDTLLGETGCAGIRVYFGMNPDLKVRVLIVAVDADNNDILPPEIGKAVNRESDDEGGDGNIVEIGAPCPDFCPSPPL